MFKKCFLSAWSVLLISCSGPNLSGFGDGLACALSGMFGPDHGTTVNTDSSEIQSTLAKVNSFEQLLHDPVADAYITKMSDRIYEQVAASDGCTGIFCSTSQAKTAADENFDESFYKRYLFESLLHSKRDLFRSNCYLFSYAKIVKTDQKDQDGKTVNLALNSSLMLRFNGEPFCDFSSKAQNRPQQEVSYCNTNGRKF